MAFARAFKVGPRALFAGDGTLLMATACAVLAPLALLAEAGAIPLMVVGLLAPLLAWWLHGRRVDRTATGGAIVGYLAGMGLTMGLVALTVVVILILTAVGLSATSVDAGRLLGQIQIVVIAVAYLAWLRGWTSTRCGTSRRRGANMSGSMSPAWSRPWQASPILWAWSSGRRDIPSSTTSG